MSGLGSPSDPCLSPLAWSVTGKYLASAMEKMVNIWQVNGNHLFFKLSCSFHYLIIHYIIDAQVELLQNSNTLCIPSCITGVFRSTECE